MQDMTLSEIKAMCNSTLCDECIFNVKIKTKISDTYDGFKFRLL